MPRLPEFFIQVRNTPSGVVVYTTGNLNGLSDDAWVARAMVDHARTLFAGGRPVLFGGTADPVQITPSQPQPKAPT